MSCGKGTASIVYNEEDDAELRRGPWTMEEDTMLIHYIACNGEGRWNMLAKCAGLKRTGKSCRLRWLNYLKPDVKRGNLTPQEQLVILELHAKWGNRWSKIAQHLPGRTDNEIKNFWRTRIQKQARQLNIDLDNQQLVSTMSQSIDRNASPSSSSVSAMSVQETNVSTSISPPSNWQHIFSHNTKPTLADSSSSFPQNQAFPALAEHHTSPNNVTYGKNLYLNNDPFQYEDCYYVDNQACENSYGQAQGDAYSATHSQVSKSDWIVDDEVANSMWNSDELWQFRS